MTMELISQRRNLMRSVAEDDHGDRLIDIREFYTHTYDDKALEEEATD